MHTILAVITVVCYTFSVFMVGLLCGLLLGRYIEIDWESLKNNRKN